MPKGILKKKPINVYEVPQRFNINEEQYAKIIEDLYNCIKSLKNDFAETSQDLWTNFTISISNQRFKIEYRYNEIPIDEKEKEKNREIWRNKYLKIGEEKYSSESDNRVETYETGLYMKTDSSHVGFDKEEHVIYEKEEKKDREKNTNDENYGGKNQILDN